MIKGSRQVQKVGKRFKDDLIVRIIDKANHPMKNVKIMFTPPPQDSASGVFENCGAESVTNDSGFLNRSFTANNIAGSYYVHARTDFGHVDFLLTNIAGPDIDSVVYDYSLGSFVHKIENAHEGHMVQFKVINVNTVGYSVLINNKGYSQNLNQPQIFSDLLGSLKFPSASSLPTVAIWDPHEKPLRNAEDSVTAEINQYDANHEDLKNFSRIASDLGLELQRDKINAEEVKSIASNLVAYNNLTLLPKEPVLPQFRDRAKNLYLKVVQSYQNLSSDSARVKRINKPDLTERFSKAKSSFEAFSKVSLDSILTLADQGGQLYFSVINSNFSATKSIFVSQSTDLIRFNVRLVARGTIFGKDSIDVLSFDLDVQRCFRLDFSAGIIYHQLRDDSYSAVDTTLVRSKLVNGKDSLTSVNGKIFTPDAISKNGFSVAAMVHYYWTPCLGFGIGGNLGVAVCPTTATPWQILGGFSAVLGRDQRVGLSYGIVYGRVKRLQSGYMPGTPYVYSNPAPMFSTVEHSFYVGLTYNLGGISAISN